jgi:hypothetical protein
VSSSIGSPTSVVPTPSIASPTPETPLVGLGLITGTVTGTAAVAADEQPLEQQAELFRALLSNPLPAREWSSWSNSYNPATDDSALARGSVPHLTDPSVHNNVDVASLLSPSQPVSSTASAAQAPAAAADPEPTFAELIERHVRRTLATRATGRHESDEVRLELTDAVLPDTSLSLRRSSAGWQLTAVTGDRGSLERLEQFTPALVERFANASLGSLEVVARLETRDLSP